MRHSRPLQADARWQELLLLLPLLLLLLPGRTTPGVFSVYEDHVDEQETAVRELTRSEQKNGKKKKKKKARVEDTYDPDW